MKIKYNYLMNVFFESKKRYFRYTHGVTKIWMQKIDLLCMGRR